MTIKLKLIFIIMDLLTLLAYPLVFIYGRLVSFQNQRKYYSSDIAKNRLNNTGQKLFL